VRSGPARKAPDVADLAARGTDSRTVRGRVGRRRFTVDSVCEIGMLGQLGVKDCSACCPQMSGGASKPHVSRERRPANVSAARERIARFAQRSSSAVYQQGLRGLEIPGEYFASASASAVRRLARVRGAPRTAHKKASRRIPRIGARARRPS